MCPSPAGLALPAPSRILVSMTERQSSLRNLRPFFISCSLFMALADASFAADSPASRPTDGLREYKDTFKVQHPYDLDAATRFSESNGVYTCWVRKGDKPLRQGSGTGPRTEMRWSLNWTRGEHMWKPTPCLSPAPTAPASCKSRATPAAKPFTSRSKKQPLQRQQSPGKCSRQRRRQMVSRHQRLQPRSRHRPRLDQRRTENHPQLPPLPRHRVVFQERRLQHRQRLDVPFREHPLLAGRFRLRRHPPPAPTNNFRRVTPPPPGGLE